MINQRSLKAVEQAIFQGEFVRPLYESYCFSRIPASIRYLLKKEGKENALPLDVFGQNQDPYDVVVLLFLDGFGWRFFDHYLKDNPFLQWFNQQGVASKITSQFPSTTAAHVTCIHTGLEVGTSGVYEWFYYEPILDRIIAPLLSSFAGDKEINTLVKAGIDTEQLYPKGTLYQKFKKEGIHSYILQPTTIAHSPYSQAMCKDATFLPFEHLNEGINSIVDLIENAPKGEKRYVCLYIGDIDAAGHHSGLFSPDYEEAVAEILRELEQNLHQKLKNSSRNAAILVTADHGMTEIDPKTTIYINQKFPELLPMLKKNQQGAPIVPAGSCRDFFLHIEEKHLEDAHELLGTSLQDSAWIAKTSKLIDEGFFGQKAPSKDFLGRVGNLVILPYGHESIWWYEKHRFEQKFHAMHGGLTRPEMETILLFASLK